jgi:uncharacterized protein (DUF1778 family)
MTAKKNDKDDTTTVSTRFDDKQKELLEDAATAANCTVSKFVRDAALQKAVAVLNASGASEVRLRQLAKMLVSHLYAAEAELITDDEGLTVGYIVRSPLYERKQVETQDSPMFVSQVNQNLANERSA